MYFSLLFLFKYTKTLQTVFAEYIYIFPLLYDTLIHSYLAVRRTFSIDNVCTFYVKYMWQLIGGCEVMSEFWTQTGSDIM